MDKRELNKKLLRAARKGQVNEIGRLLDAGADIEAHGGFFSLGQAPLGSAAYEGRKEAVEYLISRGADVGAKGEFGETVLWAAVSRGHLEIAKLLIDHGADPRVRCDTAERYTPLEVAVHHKNTEMADMLSGAIVARNLQDRLASAKAERARQERDRREKEAERAKNRDLVMVFSDLGDRTLQEIYNFASLERITLVRKGEDGPVEAVTRQDFADIGDRPALRQAFAEHVRRGGTAAEKDVFPGALQKPRPMQKDAP